MNSKGLIKAIMTTLNDIIFNSQIVPTKLFVDLISKGLDLVVNRKFKVDGSLPLNANKYGLYLTISLNFRILSLTNSLLLPAKYSLYVIFCLTLFVINVEYILYNNSRCVGKTMT